ALVQGVEKSFCPLENGGVKAFSEAVVNRLENCHCVGGTPLTAQKPGKAESDPQLPKQGALLARHLSRSSKAICRCLNRLIRGLPQQHLALDAEQFGDIPLLAVFPSPGRFDRLAHGIVCLVEPPESRERKGERSHKLRVGEPPAGLIAGVEGFTKDGQALRELVAFDQQLAAQELSDRGPERRGRARCRLDDAGDRGFGGGEIACHRGDPAHRKRAPDTSSAADRRPVPRRGSFARLVVGPFRKAPECWHAGIRHRAARPAAAGGSARDARYHDGAAGAPAPGRRVVEIDPREGGRKTVRIACATYFCHQDATRLPAFWVTSTAPTAFSPVAGQPSRNLR